MLKLPEIPTNLMGSARSAVLEAWEQSTRILETFDAAAPDKREVCASMGEQIVELYESVIRLAARMQIAQEDVARISQDEMAKTIQTLSFREVLTGDPELREILRRTRLENQHILDCHYEMSLGVKRIRAQIEFINLSLRSVATRVEKVVSSAR